VLAGAAVSGLATLMPVARGASPRTPAGCCRWPVRV